MVINKNHKIKTAIFEGGGGLQIVIKNTVGELKI